MRLDARKGDPWQVWHVEWCCMVPCVRWVDDETAQWCECLRPYRVVDGSVQTRIHQARRIEILHASRLVLINPIDDELELHELDERWRVRWRSLAGYLERARG